MCRDELTVDRNDAITDFNEVNVDTNSFNLKVKLTCQTGNNGTRDVEIMVKMCK